MMETICFIRQTAIYNDSRATKTIKSLSKKYNVIVLAWDRNGNAHEKIDGIFPDNVTIEYYKKRLPHGSGIKGIFKLVGFIKWTKQQIKKHTREINYVHACDLDGAIGIFKYAQKKCIPLIYDIYDYYVDSHTIPSVLRNILEKKEIEIINKAFCTIICSESRIAQIGKATPNNLCIIHNSPDCEIKPHDIADFKSECIKLVYVGVLSQNRLLKEITDLIAEHEHIMLYVGGTGPLQSYFMGVKAKNFAYLGEMKYSEVLELENQADILFATYDPQIQNHKFSAPNKLYEALALGKPIIVCKGTGIDKIVDNEAIGKSISYSPQEFYDAVKELCTDREKYKKISENMKYLYNSQYRWEIMESRIFDVYNKAAKLNK